MEANFISQGRLVPGSSHRSVQSFNFRVSRRWICWDSHIPSVSVILHLGKSITFGSCGGEHIQASLDRSGKLSIVLCWMDAPWPPIVLNMLEDVHHWFPIGRNLIRDVSVGHDLKGLSSLHLKPFSSSETCCADKGSLLYSFRQWCG